MSFIIDPRYSLVKPCEETSFDGLSLVHIEQGMEMVSSGFAEIISSYEYAVGTIVIVKQADDNIVVNLEDEIHAIVPNINIIARRKE